MQYLHRPLPREDLVRVSTSAADVIARRAVQRDGIGSRRQRVRRLAAATPRRRPGAQRVRRRRSRAQAGLTWSTPTTWKGVEDTIEEAALHQEPRSRAER